MSIAGSAPPNISESTYSVDSTERIVLFAIRLVSTRNRYKGLFYSGDRVPVGDSSDVHLQFRKFGSATLLTSDTVCGVMDSLHRDYGFLRRPSKLQSIVQKLFGAPTEQLEVVPIRCLRVISNRFRYDFFEHDKTIFFRSYDIFNVPQFETNMKVSEIDYLESFYQLACEFDQAP